MSDCPTTGITLEFTGDGRILAHDSTGSVQVGVLTSEIIGDPGETEWKAFLWRYADTEAEFGRLDGKMAGLRFAPDEAELQRRVRSKLLFGGPWWTAKPSPVRMPNGVMDYLENGAGVVETAEAETRSAAGDPETYERALARQQERLTRPSSVRHTGTPILTRLFELLAPDEGD